MLKTTNQLYYSLRLKSHQMLKVWLSIRQNLAPEDAPIFFLYVHWYPFPTHTPYSHPGISMKSSISVWKIAKSHLFQWFEITFSHIFLRCSHLLSDHVVKNTTGLLKLSSMMAAVRPAYEKKMQLWLDSPALRENVENPYFEGNTSGFRLRFSLKSVISYTRMFVLVCTRILIRIY